MHSLMRQSISQHHIFKKIEDLYTRIQLLLHCVISRLLAYTFGIYLCISWMHQTYAEHTTLFQKAGTLEGRTKTYNNGVADKKSVILSFKNQLNVDYQQLITFLCVFSLPLITIDALHSVPVCYLSPHLDHEVLKLFLIVIFKAIFSKTPSAI